MAIDYTYFYKRKFESLESLKGQCSYDTFISSYNSSDRVKRVFEEINSKRKIWLLLPEYNHEEEIPEGDDVFTYSNESEAELIREFINQL